MCWIEGGPNRIWKQRWDNGAAQAYSGFAGYTAPWREVVGPGGEGERPEAIGVFQEFSEKKGIPVLANCLLISSLSLASYSRVLGTRAD